MKLLTTTEVAKLIDRSAKHVQYLARTEKLKRANPQCYSNFLFNRIDVENYLQKSSKHNKSANISKFNTKKAE